MTSRGARRSRTAAAIALTLAGSFAQAASATTYVRVNQVGYGSGQSGRAYVMTTSSITSESFQIVDSTGKVVDSGTVGSTTGKWGSYHVYPVDSRCRATATTTSRSWEP